MVRDISLSFLGNENGAIVADIDGIRFDLLSAPCGICGRPALTLVPRVIGGLSRQRCSCMAKRATI